MENAENTKGVKKANKNLKCEACEADGIQKPAIAFCIDCQDYLCFDCSSYHCVTKPTKHHKVLLQHEMPERKASTSLSEDCAKHKELQTRLIEFYRENVLHMSAIPLQSEGNMCDFKNVYVRPRMMIETKDEFNEKATDVLSMSDIFTKDGKSIKSIFIIGGAGSGKSSFCKSLEHYWC
ncbi:uncharacterized protein LOC128558947 [Mercenaria mercenaria]|uniref:uncharacterized protein LOC128558947 n=1 Tax=Mercenaria mercenaria TaxID=6596 RepID=UPI00234E463E|nr:uncharacterized protein LOC128558947 [Mercenaria mercenaria]